MSNLVWSTEAIENEDILEIIEDHIYYMGEVLQNKFGEIGILRIDATNLNWRGSSGYKEVNLDLDPYDLAREIIPSHDCTLELYEDGNELYFIYYSHDVPTGGTWRLSKTN